MKRDSILQELNQLEAARRSLASELERLGQALELNRRLRQEGCSVTQIFRESPGPEVRRRVRLAWASLNRSLHDYRAEAIRSLVEDEGLTISEVARRTGKARQVISRLYHASGRR